MVKVSYERNGSKIEKRYEHEDPQECLQGLVAQDLDWEIDYTHATEQQADAWMTADIVMSCELVMNRGLPVKFFDELHFSMTALHDAIERHPYALILGLQEENGCWHLLTELLN